MNKIINSLAESTFEQDVLHSDLPVLVDYWAEWCAPCKAMAPVLDELAEEYRDRLRVVKVNVEQEPADCTPVLYAQPADADVVQEQLGRSSEGRRHVQVAAQDVYRIESMRLLLPWIS